MDNTTVLNTDTAVSDQEIIDNAVATLTGDKERWVLWCLEEHDGNTKKVPYGRHGYHASSTESDSWFTYMDAWDAYSNYDDFDGIGLMFDGTILGVDFDKCLQDGEITDPIVKAFVHAADSYTDISPSGTGLHVYFKLSGPLHLKKNRHEMYEVYTKGRYFTFSKHLYNKNEVRTISPTEAEALLKILGYPWNAVAEAVNQVVSGNSTNLDLEIVKQKMFASQNGTQIKALYDGDTSAYGGDTSSADVALCQQLNYWTNSNREAMKTLWLESGLAERDKTQTREDYVERTLNFALTSSEGATDGELTLSGADSNNTKTRTPSMVFAQEEIDLEDLLKMHITTEWDVEQLITKGSLNMIASPPHQGKTFMALHIAVCVANGLPVFGKFKVTKMKNVMIVNEEDVLADIKGRLESMVPKERNGKRIKLYSNMGMKVSEAWVDGLLERAKANGTGLVILDSLAALSLANENEAQAMQQVMDLFRRIVNAGITVVFIHHDRKGQSQDTDAGSLMDKARGSSAITAAVHGYLSVKELNAEEFVVTQVKLKANTPKIKPFVVHRQLHTEKDASFRFEFEYVGEYNREASAADGIEERVVKLCQKHGESYIFTRKTLVHSGIANSTEDKTLRQSLKWMVQKKLLEECPYGELAKEKQGLVQDEVQRANTLVYIPTLKLLGETDDDVDDGNIPF